jgi:hypothetical protein
VVSSSVKEDDSGICSDLTNSNSYSSSSNNSSANPLSSSTSNNNSMSTNPSDTSMTHTPVSNESLSKKKATNYKLSSLFKNLRMNNSSSKTRVDLFNLRMEGEPLNTQTSKANASNNSSSLLERFSGAKNLFSKIIHHHSKETHEKDINQCFSPELTAEKSIPGENSCSELPPMSPESSVGFHETEEECSSLAENSFSPVFHDQTSSPPPKVVENKKLFDSFAMNMHRIDKDVVRCDRSYWFFSKQENLDKLKNIIYT